MEEWTYTDIPYQALSIIHSLLYLCYTWYKILPNRNCYLISDCIPFLFSSVLCWITSENSNHFFSKFYLTVLISYFNKGFTREIKIKCLPEWCINNSKPLIIAVPDLIKPYITNCRPSYHRTLCWMVYSWAIKKSYSTFQNMIQVLHLWKTIFVFNWWNKNTWYRAKINNEDRILFS